MIKYLYISISSVTPMGDRNKYKSETSDLNKYRSDTNISINIYPTGDKYQSDRSSSICPLGDLNMYKI